MAAPIFDLPANEQSNRDRRIDVGAGYVSVGVSQPEHDQAVRECDGHKAAANGPRAGPDEDECKGSNEFRCQCSAVHARSLSLIFPEVGIRLTQVAPRCSMPADGRLPSEPARVRGPF